MPTADISPFFSFFEKTRSAMTKKMIQNKRRKRTINIRRSKAMITLAMLQPFKGF
jgi:hypothetical protein